MLIPEKQTLQKVIQTKVDFSASLSGELNSPKSIVNILKPTLAN